MLTAIRPISASGWRTVVSAGETTVAVLDVVEADDREVLGDAEPAARAAWIAPIARLSLKAKIAVGGSRQVRGAWLGRDQAAGDLEVALDLELRLGQDPGRRERGVVAAAAVVRRDPARAGR